ncbi:MAG: MBL fold metallo-hydrolase [Clostridiales bacterium]|nr:MBL fold metallo-hydrolase [Clostridiales bacterium]
MATKKTSSSGKSSAKTNVKRVATAVSKYDTSKSVRDNSEAIKGVVSATATSARRSGNKKQKTFFTVLLIILIIAILATLIYGYYSGWFDSVIGYGNRDYDSKTYSVAAIQNEQLSIHFMQLNNKSNGDSIYIKAGDTDILIDAGSEKASAKSIGDYIDRYCTDGILEYVIATHADEDHIAGFVGTTVAKGIFDRYECKNIIQFARTNKNTKVYQSYCEKRDAEKANGANVYTALQCYNNENGAKRIYELADGITMEILYQKYYETTTSNENDYSVCLRISQDYLEDGEIKTNHYMLLGDLEEDGEKSLVENNPDLPEVVLYKGGHHGSKTSGNTVLLDKIKPQIVCICCVAGSVEYTQALENTFPTQDFINRIAQYTDAVYATDVATVDKNSSGKYKNTGFDALNGDIVFACTNGEVSMYFSNNDTKLKDTEWFKQNRTCPQAWV